MVVCDDIPDSLLIVLCILQLHYNFINETEVTQHLKLQFKY